MSEPARPYSSWTIYGSETWAMKAEDMQRPERTERMMIRWIFDVKLSVRKANVDLVTQNH